MTAFRKGRRMLRYIKYKGLEVLRMLVRSQVPPEADKSENLRQSVQRTCDSRWRVLGMLVKKTNMGFNPSLVFLTNE